MSTVLDSSIPISNRLAPDSCKMVGPRNTYGHMLPMTRTTSNLSQYSVEIALVSACDTKNNPTPLRWLGRTPAMRHVGSAGTVLNSAITCSVPFDNSAIIPTCIRQHFRLPTPTSAVWRPPVRHSRFKKHATHQMLGLRYSVSDSVLAAHLGKYCCGGTGGAALPCRRSIGRGQPGVPMTDGSSSCTAITSITPYASLDTLNVPVHRLTDRLGKVTARQGVPLSWHDRH